jgi:hypothetical protein
MPRHKQVEDAVQQAGFVTPGDANSSAGAIRTALAHFGVASAQPSDVAGAHALATRLIGGTMAEPSTITEIHRRTGAGLFVARDESGVVGLLAFLLLSESGADSLLGGSLDTLQPAADDVVTGGEEPAAVYSWAIAAADHNTAKSLVGGHERVRHVAVPHLPFYLRPVTPKGRRLAVLRLGFKPLPGSRSGLFWSAPRARSLVEAAA